MAVCRLPIGLSLLLSSLLATLVLEVVSSSINAESTYDQDEVAHIRKKREPISALATALISTAISSGVTVATTAAQIGAAADYRVYMKMTIDNYSKWVLYDAVLINVNGVVLQPPINILPGKQEQILTRKPGLVAEGTRGTVTWKVTNGTRMAVLYSAPFNFNYYPNRMNVGVIPENWGALKELYTILGENAQEYRSDLPISRIQQCSIYYCVEGIMSTSHHAEIKVAIFPTSWDDLSPSVQALFDKTQYASLIPKEYFRESTATPAPGDMKTVAPTSAAPMVFKAQFFTTIAVLILMCLNLY